MPSGSRVSAANIPDNLHRQSFLCRRRAQRAAPSLGAESRVAFRRGGAGRVPRKIGRSAAGAHRPGSARPNLTEWALKGAEWPLSQCYL